MNRVLCIYMGDARLPNACEIYRGNMPLHHLNRYEDWTAEWAYWGDVADLLAHRGSMAYLQMIQNHDLFIFPRAFAANNVVRKGLTSLVGLLRELGKRVIYEVDDDYTNQHRVVVKGDAMGIARLTDAITVTTPMLAQLMEEKTGRPAHILPNSIDFDLWERGEPAHQPSLEGKIVIGLTGSKTHKYDWQILKNVLPRIASEHSNVHIILMGYHPDYLANMPNTSYLPGADYVAYSHIIRRCDIILCPINSDPFNFGKSPIKAVEGQGASRTLNSVYCGGAAVIASNHPVYSLAIQHMFNGFLANWNEEEWYLLIKLMIEREDIRIQAQVNGLKSAFENFNMSKNVELWKQAYQTVLELPPNQTPLKFK